MPIVPNPEPVAVGGDGTVLAERHGHVLLVTLNRPDARNAVNNELMIGVGEALDHAEDTPDVWAVIVTGAGDKSFCAGADLKEAATGRLGEGDDRFARWGFAGYVSHHISKPTIAAVNGFALGGGTEIVLASDLAVAVDTASFGLPEVKRGIFAGAGGAFRLPPPDPGQDRHGAPAHRRAHVRGTRARARAGQPRGAGRRAADRRVRARRRDLRERAAVGADQQAHRPRHHRRPRRGRGRRLGPHQGRGRDG